MLNLRQLPKSVVLSITALFLTVLAFVSLDTGIFFEHYYISWALGHASAASPLQDDVFATGIVPQIAPLLLFWTAALYSSPLFQLAASFLSYFLLAYVLLLFITDYTGSRSVAFWTAAALLLNLQLAFHMGSKEIPLLSLDTYLSLWLSSADFKEAHHFSFRNVAHILIIVALVLFLKKRYLLSGLVLGVGSHMHPFNSINAALVMGTALFLRDALGQKQPMAALKRAALFFGCFGMLAAIVAWRAEGLSRFGAPMDFATYWIDFVWKNEPDDVSAVLILTFSKRLVLFSLLVPLLLLASRTPRPWTWRNLGLALREERVQMVALLCWLPVVLFSGQVIWEGLKLYRFLPDGINQLVINLETRRSTMIALLLFSPILLGWVLHFAEFIVSSAKVQLLGVVESSALRKLDEKSFLNMILALVLLTVATVKNPALGSRLENLGKMATTASFQPMEFFEHNEVDNWGSCAYVQENAAEFVQDATPCYSLESLLDATRWINASLPEDASVFNPPYIARLRGYILRKMYLIEKFEGTWAVKNRIFADIYVQRFRDLLGFDYAAFDGIVSEGGPGYLKMRRAYAEKTIADWHQLREKYPAYGYLLAESSTHLELRELYRNQSFVVYQF